MVGVNLDVNYYLRIVVLMTALGLTYMGYFLWKKEGKLYILLCLLTVSIYQLGYAFELLHENIVWIKFMTKIEYFGIVLLPLIWLVFSLHFTSETVFYHIKDSIIVLDSKNNIVNLNGSAKKMVRKLNQEGFDKSIEELFEEYEEVLAMLGAEKENDVIISIKDRNICYYKVNISHIYKRNRKIDGKILIFNDVTQMERDRRKLGENLNFLQTFINAIPNPIYAKNLHGVYINCNFAFTDFLGLKKEQVIGLTDSEIFEKNMADFYQKYDQYLLEQKKSQSLETKMRHKDGTFHDVIFSKSIVSDELGDYKGIAGVIIDITEQKRNIEKLNKLLKLKETMIKIMYSMNEIEHVEDLLKIIVIELINCIDNRCSGLVLLLDEDNNLKIPVAVGYRDEDMKTFCISLKDYFTWYHNGLEIEKTVILKDFDKISDVNMFKTKKGLRIKSSLCSPVVINGVLLGFLTIDSEYADFFSQLEVEIMEYMRMQVANAIIKHRFYGDIVHLSRYDTLTNVYNRSYFEKIFQEGIYGVEEKSDFWIAIFDINGLKTVNDNLGHLAGDALIKKFAQGLQYISRGRDMIARYGGDEFVGVFYHTDQDELNGRLRSLMQYAIEHPISYEEHVITYQFSYGIVHFPLEGKRLSDLIRIADERMYQYKRSSKCKKMDNVEL